MLKMLNNTICNAQKNTFKFKHIIEDIMPFNGLFLCSKL